METTTTTMQQHGGIKIRKFDPRSMVEHPVILMVAKRCSGKSTLVKDLMYYRRHVTAGLAMSATEAGNGFYSSWIPPLFVYNEFDKGALERLMAQQIRLTRQGNAEPVFVILDDCAFDKKTLNDKLMRELLYNGRHFKITVFMCVQYVMDLSPNLRANIDYVFALRENVYREKLYKNFFPIVGNLATFNALMDACTSDFGALVLDNRSHSSKLHECLYWYKAKLDRKPFRIGGPSFWKYSGRHYDKKADDEEQFPPKTNKLIVSVRRVGA